MTNIGGVLPLVLRVCTLALIVVLFVYFIRYTKSQSRILPAQNGPAYLRHKTMISNTRSVLMISLFSVALSLGALSMPFYYGQTGQIDVQNDANEWCKFYIIYNFLESLGCVNFFFYMILIKDFRVALKKLNLKMGIL